ncbi:MAG: NAD(P)/FAD-dependent oxidoreductase [Candidatus Thorarchaeota archaeon]
MKNHYDTIIIGGGPAGCSAALHLAYHERSVLVLDRGTSPMYFHTNSIMNFASTETYHEGRTLLRQMQSATSKMGAEFREANVVAIRGQYPDFTVITKPSQYAKDENEYHCKTLLIATGTARKHPKVDGMWRKWLPIANVGNGAFYCPDCEAPLCKDKEVLVVNVGTAGSALHVANAISRFTSKVKILMTEDAFIPFDKRDCAKLYESNFEWVHGTIKEIDFPRPGKVQSITLDSGEKLRANVFFVAFVASPRTELAQSLGVDVDSKGNILTDHRGKTNIEGLWAAGDCRAITQQISMATGTGNYAALMINQFLGNDAEKEEIFDHPEIRGFIHME